MDPVLIFTDTARIENEQETLENVVPVFQAIYNAIKAAGITAPTLAEVYALVQKAGSQSTTDFVNAYVNSKLTAQAGVVVVNGVNTVATIMMPNTAAITAALQPVWGGNKQNVLIGQSPNYYGYLSLAADVISAVEGAGALITAAYTYSTNTDESAALATEIQAVCDALNGYQTAYSGINILKNFPAGNRRVDGIPTIMPGVVVRDGVGFAIDLNFIQKFERYNGNIYADMLTN